MSELSVEIQRVVLHGIAPAGDGSSLAPATEAALRRLVDRWGLPPGADGAGSGAEVPTLRATVTAAGLAEELAVAIYRSIPGEGRAP